LIRSHRDAYFDSQDSLEKKLIVCRIVDAILQRGGRFLKRVVHANTWTVVPKDVARIKAAHAIQYRQRKSLQLSQSPAPAPPPDASRASFSNHHDESMPVDLHCGSQRDPNYSADIPTWVTTLEDSSIWEPIEFKATAAAHQKTFESTSMHSNVGTASALSSVHQYGTAHVLVCTEIGPLESSPPCSTDPFTIAPCACKQVHTLRRAKSPSLNRLVRTTSIGSFDAQEMYDKSHGDILW
jgi:hypothetical protein